MKLIALSGKHGRGKSAIVDDEDYEYLMQWKWHYSMCAIGYAKRTQAESKEGGGQKFRPVMMHRVIMKLIDPKTIIDHIDNDPLNNQKSNLRIATVGQNRVNSRRNRIGTSKYRGVSIERKRKYWRATVIKDHKSYIKEFKTEVEAALWYNEKAKELHGEFAKLNII